MRRYINALLIICAWGIFFLGMTVAASAFFVPQDTSVYERAGWTELSENPPGFEYVP